MVLLKTSHTSQRGHLGLCMSIITLQQPRLVGSHIRFFYRNVRITGLSYAKSTRRESISLTVYEVELMIIPDIFESTQP